MRVVTGMVVVRGGEGVQRGRFGSVRELNEDTRPAIYG